MQVTTTPWALQSVPWASGLRRDALLVLSDCRPLLERLLISLASNWPHVMCILCRVGVTPAGSMRGLWGNMKKLCLLPMMHLFTLRLLLWLWL